MKCHTCGRTLRPGQMVVPVMKVHDSARYDPAPATQPAAYIHVIHIKQEES